MAFFQDAPRLGNQYTDDDLAREYVARVMPAATRAAAEAEYAHLGELAGGELYRAMLADLDHEPVLTQWDPWGKRIDAIEISPLWKRAQALAAEHGLVAAGYESTHGDRARVHQYLLNYVVQASLDFYSCPLAMTDGAAKTLRSMDNPALSERALPHLLSRAPSEMWTSGQWMTERTGGSDVGLSETEARQDGDRFRLYGTKWFTSATTSQMALTLARPTGARPGGRGLAMFYVELRDADGRLQGIAINRLKDKLGTRKVPTAELTLEGTPAIPVGGLEDGIKNITPMLGVTRTWNAIGAAWYCRRALALATDFAGRRLAFGKLLRDQPLHADTLAWMRAETEGVFHLAFRLAELAGKIEHGTASETDELAYRILTPIAKLTTCKQAVAVTSEGIEAFGGAGYVEDTGLPRLLADAQVLPIWEGTTNVLALDTLRAMAREKTFEALLAELGATLDRVTAASLKAPATAARESLERAAAWLRRAGGDPNLLEAGARRFAMTLGRTAELAYATAHAQWCRDDGHGDRATQVAVRLATQSPCLITGAEG
jgi:alkylation response protein AidB-like acyl-CoA dehydrogenase